MLACLRAGIPYVPVDAAAPGPRARFMLDDARLDTVLFESAEPQWLARTTATLRRLRLADLAPGGLRELASRDAGGAGPVVRSSPGEVAYILYTSGSTGEPKGISTSTCPSSTSSSA